MKIVIDMQGAQSTDSRNRGIGRYTLAFVKALAGISKVHELHFLFNGIHQDSISEICKSEPEIYHSSVISIWHPTEALALSVPENWTHLETVTQERVDLFHHLGADLVLLTSVVEGFHDDTNAAFTAISLPRALPIRRSFHVAIIAYDLIPLIYPATYLNGQLIQDWYQQCLSQMKEADLLLAISEATGRDLIQYLGVSDRRVRNISGAVDPAFKPIKPSEIAPIKNHLEQCFAIKSNYILYTGGIDARKNVEGLIAAYAQLPSKLRTEYPLVLVCAIGAHDQARLLNFANHCNIESGQFFMTGFVSQEQLIWLYQCCHAFVFPSFHEGLGLPVLEALACERPVVASWNSSIPEVLGLQEAGFDPSDSQQLVAKLLQVITDPDFRQRLITHAGKQAAQFTWESTAQKALTAFEQLPKHPPNKPDLNVQRIAIVSPVAPVKSGISTYSLDLLPMLSQKYQVDVVVDQQEVEFGAMNRFCQLRRTDWLRKHYSKYRFVIYQIGNSPHHRFMLELMRDCPGIVDLHDLVLKDLAHCFEYFDGKPNVSSEILYHDHGYPALVNRDAPWPCLTTFLKNATGAIVHSQHAAHLVAQSGACEESKVRVVGLPRPVRAPQSAVQRARARFALGIDPNCFVITSFGFVTTNKAVVDILHAVFASKLLNQKSVLLCFVGEALDQSGIVLYELGLRYGCQDQIRQTGWISSETYEDYLYAGDIAVQLRSKSMGETSAALLDCLSVGLPTIVNSIGSANEFSSEIVLKVSQSPPIPELSMALENLYSSSTARAGFAKAGYLWMKDNGSTEKIVSSYCKTIEYLQPNFSKNDSDIDEIDLRVKQKVLPRLLIDISDWINPESVDPHEALALASLRQLLQSSPNGIRVEAVIATQKGELLAPISSICHFLKIKDGAGRPVNLSDGIINPQVGDTYLLWNRIPTPNGLQTTVKGVNEKDELSYLNYDLVDFSQLGHNIFSEFDSSQYSLEQVLEILGSDKLLEKMNQSLVCTGPN